ncbi:PREDICTED: uncharacterized protein LOC105972055 [Erythranthe guttata]|uniref:uncharacterized protein LOC105972055 n=1 Tax=Erythranthe guttata TaxID=4155 RepID=UPI00064DAF32|nr:PREDICTED: uncharacterized protein LOC105972055 [Erythranthe guttata]|eukprot:XP_012852442.1 PREDICTED: uncharacterized protein LOC105972055 [Erythranthe guttata]
MEGLQRYAVSFRRQGSSGSVWDDKFLAGLQQLANQQDASAAGVRNPSPPPVLRWVCWWRWFWVEDCDGSAGGGGFGWKIAMGLLAVAYVCVVVMVMAAFFGCWGGGSVAEEH